MKGDTLRKKFNEWSSPRGSEPRFSVARSHRDSTGSELDKSNLDRWSHRDSTGSEFDKSNLDRWSSEDNIDKVNITFF